MESGGSNKREVPKNDTSCSVPVKKLNISSLSSKIDIGADVEVVCSSEMGCLPINYTLFLNTSRRGSAVKNKKNEIVTFKFTIKSINELGEYKCRAQNGLTNTSNLKYSPGFHFTLREEENNMAVLIGLPLLLLLALIGIALAIPWLILPWCKARKLRTASVSVGLVTTNYPHSKNSPTSYPHSENCPTYDDIAFRKNEETEYCNVNISNKENCRNGKVCLVFYKWNKTRLKFFISEDSTVNYAEIIIRS
ncbi:allergin-1 isoform X2 [Elgaria multicarinata webbii]